MFICWICGKNFAEDMKHEQVSEIVREPVCWTCVEFPDELIEQLIKQYDDRYSEITTLRAILKSAYEKSDPGTIVRGFLENECERLNILARDLKQEAI